MKQERRKVIVSSLLCEESQTDWYYALSRNYDKIVMVLAWVLRFVNRCRKIKAKQGSEKAVRWEEIRLSEKFVIRYVQRESFTGPQTREFLVCVPIRIVRVLFALGPNI